MRKLSRIVLINAAGFDYLEFPVGGHGQVIGVNGHGKSTLLRTVLFFYLGSNEKAPYALHETKADFISHYLGEPPSYLIYEVERGENEPAFHIAVTRPAGRVQFHFVDAPYERGHYLEGAFVQPVQTVLERLREAGCAVDSVGSYDQYVQRIYGMLSSPYAVFRPVARSSGQIGVLPRIISGIFTVSQLDADKLKSALTCGMRSDAASGELDLALLKGQLEHFRRVNRAVKTYLNHEQQALELVGLAESYEAATTERLEAIRELVRTAGRLPEQASLLAAEETNLKAEREAEAKRHLNESAGLEETIQSLREEIAVLDSKIRHGETLAREYQERSIDEKAGKLLSLPMLKEEKTLADEEYRVLTTRFEDESQRKDSLLTNAKAAQAKLAGDFALRRAESERVSREASGALDRERETAMVFIEQQQRTERAALVPRRKGVEQVRSGLNAEFRELGEMEEPAELARTRRGVEQRKQIHSETVDRLNQLRSKLDLSRAILEKEQQALEHQIRVEHDRLQQELDRLKLRREQLETELEKFDDSLAHFYQKHAPEGWAKAEKTLHREVLFQNAQALGATAAGDAQSVWGVTISTDSLPSSDGGFDRDALVCLLEETRKQLADAADRQQAAQERYAAGCMELEKRTAQENEALQSEIRQLNERRSNNADELNRLENNALTLEAQWKQQKLQRRESLEKRDAELKEEEEAIRRQEEEAEERFRQSRNTLSDEIRRKKTSLAHDAAERIAVIEAEEERAQAEWSRNVSRIEEDFQKALAEKGVDQTLLKSAQKRSDNLEAKIRTIESFRNEVHEYQVKKREVIDLLSGWQSERRMRKETLQIREDERREARERHEGALRGFAQRQEKLNRALSDLQRDQLAEERFRADPRFASEQSFFDKDDLTPAAFYRPGAVADSLKQAEVAHEQREDIAKKGDREARSFLNRFDAETLDRKVLGFSPLHLYFDWFIFANTELKPFVDRDGIRGMRNIQTQEFEQLIRNIRGKNAAFRDGIREVNQTASLVQKNLEANNFVDVLDAVELKVERVDSRLTQVLTELEEFSDLTFGGDHDLFGKRADRQQAEKAISAFERLLKEIDNHRGTVLRLTDCFDFLIRVHENGNDMGWRKSLDHIGSTGTDYLVKMLIYLSLIEVYRERTIDSKEGVAAVHCVMDETGVLAAKYIRSVLDYAKDRHIILITAGHSQQTVGFENWVLVRKRGKRFAGQSVLRKVLKCD